MAQTPISILDVLAAVTPIVTSVSSTMTKNKEMSVVDSKRPNINITINNNFYTDSPRAREIAEKLDNEILKGISDL